MAPDVNPVTVAQLAAEWRARLRRGDPPSLDDYLARYPELADEIRELFPTVVLLEDLKADAVGATLERLRASGYDVLHDVHWPGRRRANIDHVAIGPAGIVVVDAKNWSGVVSAHHGRLRQNGNRRDNSSSSTTGHLSSSRRFATCSPGRAI